MNKNIMLFVSMSILIIFSTSKVVADVLRLPEGHTYPNGITHDESGNIYVGFVTDGTIYKKTIDSDKWEVFYPGSENIFSTTSLRYDRKNNLIWGTSPDFLGIKNDKNERYFRQNRIFALNANTGVVEKIIMIPKGSFGNDITIDDAGNLYITDSFKPRIFILKEGSENLNVYIVDPMLGSKERVGLSGITKTPSGNLFVANYSNATFLRVSHGGVDEIKLSRTIQNPDGLYALSENAFIAIIGAVESGNGEVLRVDVRDTEKGLAGTVNVIASGLTSPVNLSISMGILYVTESKIRHILIDKKSDAPKDFFIHKYKEY